MPASFVSLLLIAVARADRWISGKTRLTKLRRATATRDQCVVVPPATTAGLGRAAALLLLIGTAACPAAQGRPQPVLTESREMARAAGDDADGKRPAETLLRPGMELRFAGSRHYQTLYWRIEPDGKGEVAAPLPTGYVTDFEKGRNFRYVFAGGVHRFDIGESGYAELRRSLSDIIEGQIDHLDLTDAGSDATGLSCRIARTLDRPSMQLTWAGDGNGTFLLRHHLCRSMRGNDLADRMRSTWRVLARHMLERGQVGVSKQSLPLPPQAPHRPSMPIPYRLELRQHEVRAGRTLTWHIAADGRGWLDLSKGMTFQVPPAISPTEFLALETGHYRFDIGPQGYGKVHALMDPYVTGPDRLAPCDDGSTDRPLIRLSWEFAPRGMAGELHQDRGCRDLAERADRALLIMLAGMQAASRNEHP